MKGKTRIGFIKYELGNFLTFISKPRIWLKIIAYMLVTGFIYYASVDSFGIGISMITSIVWGFTILVIWDLVEYRWQRYKEREKQ